MSIYSRKYSYDPACEELARHFLIVNPDSDDDERRVKELAQYIQHEVENWLDDEGLLK